MRIVGWGLTLWLVLAAATPATAAVHFGNNVFVGGYDFSHRTYDRRHRGLVKLYDHPIRHPGCVTRRDSTLETCRLQRVRH